MHSVGRENAPLTFERAMDVFFSLAKLQIALVYLADVVMFLQTPRGPIIRAQSVSACYGKRDSSSNSPRARFLSTQIDFIYHMIQSGRLPVLDCKTVHIAGLPAPTIVAVLRSFISFCNTCRRFVPNFSRTAVHLTRQLQNNHPY